MRILVVGGSYFYGRVFVMLASKEHSVTVVNRGTYSMEEFGVKQVKGDRHDPETWRQCRENQDVVVDFCAYGQGDISFVLEHLGGKVKQYILISTVDVYRRGTGRLLDEEAPLETRRFPGETGAYISGKVALEQELRQQCSSRGIAWTVLRPAILYGPYNYAPREALYIRMMVQEGILPEITDADGRFGMVYVKDGAEALLKCLGAPAAFDRAFNLCGEEEMDYRTLSELLRRAAARETPESQEAAAVQSVRTVPMTAEEAESRGIPLPFPVRAEETERYSNERGKRELGIAYTPAEEGIARTYRAFAGIFRA